MLKGVCVQEIKIDKMESNIVRSFVNEGKRVLEKVDRGILAGFLAKVG